MLRDLQTTFEGRISLCAESLERRETTPGSLWQNGLKAKPMSSWQGLSLVHEPLIVTVTPLAYGFKLGGLQSPDQRQSTPDPEGESKAVTDQTGFSAAATSPPPGPLLQEGKQNAATISDDLRTESSLYPVKSTLHGQAR